MEGGSPNLIKYYQWLVIEILRTLVTKITLIKQLLINISIDVLLDINLVKKTLSCQLREKPSLPPPTSHIHTPRRITFSEIVLWQRCFPWNSPRHPKLFLGQTLPESYREPWEILNHKGVIYTFVRRCLLQEQILFCSINVKTFSKNAGIEINLLCSALKRYDNLY